MMLDAAVVNFIDQQKLLPFGATVIVGFSGGPDSVFLLQQLKLLKESYSLQLIAAHLNHGWRPEAEQEAQWCAHMAHDLGIEFVTAHAQDFPELTADGSQEALGRTVRRAFFNRVAQKYTSLATPVRIALAHHEDDQIETFFIRLIRGAGLEGLTGIAAQDGIYIRPLLPINKATILATLTSNNIPYLVDPTNMQTTYLRNCIRHQALPALAACDHRFSAHVIKAMKHLAQAEDFIAQQVATYFATIRLVKGETVWIDREALLAAHPFLRMRTVLYWLTQAGVPFTPSERLFAEIERFLEQPGNKSHVFYQQWLIAKEANKATIYRINQ